MAPAGQIVLLPAEPAQLALDGTPMEPVGSLGNPLAECAAAELPDVPSWERRQLAFDFDSGGVQMSFENWQQDAARAVDWFGAPDRATRIRTCGSRVQLKACKDCEQIDLGSAVRSADCMSRVCPSCARKTAQGERAKLLRAMERWPWKRRAKSWFFYTGTCRRPPGTNVVRLQGDLERCSALGLAVWHKLKGWGCERAMLRFEVGRGGMVHFHMLAHHKWLGAARLAELRALAVKLCDSPMFNVRRANQGSCAEVAKYVTKGVARSDAGANQTHPVLSAMVDVAFYGRKLWRWYGDWKGIDTDEIEPSWSCPCCGCIGQSRSIYMTNEQYAALAAKQATREGAAA